MTGVVGKGEFRALASQRGEGRRIVVLDAGS